jgi:hypothetical protein
MRVWLALAAVLIFCASANAQSVAARCAAEADANGLQGTERVRFEARCKTARYVAARHAPRDYWEPPHAYCVHPVNNVANVLIGSCPPCVLLWSLTEDGARCPSR